MLGVIRKTIERRARERIADENRTKLRIERLRLRGIWLSQDELGVWQMPGSNPEPERTITKREIAFHTARWLGMYGSPFLYDWATDSIAGAALLAGVIIGCAWIRYDPTMSVLRASAIVVHLLLADPKPEDPCSSN